MLISKWFLPLATTALTTGQTVNGKSPENEQRTEPRTDDNSGGFDIGSLIDTGIAVYQIYTILSPLWTPDQDQIADVEQLEKYWKGATKIWNAKISREPGYIWASQYGSGTEVMAVDLSWEERNMPLGSSKSWTSKKRTLYFAVTPYYEFRPGKVSYKETIRRVKGRDNLSQAKEYIQSTGFNRATAEAFSPLCRHPRDIIEVHTSDIFNQDNLVIELGKESTTLPWLLIYQLLKTGLTDFELRGKGYTGQSKINALKGNGIAFTTSKERRNLLAKAQITGDLAAPLRWWLIVPTKVANL